MYNDLKVVMSGDLGHKVVNFNTFNTVFNINGRAVTKRVNKGFNGYILSYD